MRVVASESATQLIRENGGRLYVWTKRNRGCCGGVRLVSGSVPPPGTAFRLVGDAEFELYLPASLRRAPTELHLALRRFPRRVEAYWDNCAWVV